MHELLRAAAGPGVPNTTHLAVLGQSKPSTAQGQHACCAHSCLRGCGLDVAATVCSGIWVAERMAEG